MVDFYKAMWVLGHLHKRRCPCLVGHFTYWIKMQKQLFSVWDFKEFDFLCGMTLPQSGTLPRSRQVPGHQYRRGAGDGQSAEQRRGDEGHFYQAHPGRQSCWTERDTEDRRQDCRGDRTCYKLNNKPEVGFCHRLAL